MNDRQIQIFLEVVNQNNNFTKAAEALYVSQPALSKQMSRLESELGTTLFDTAQKKSVTLTEAGRIYYDYFSKEQKRFCRVQKEVAQLDKRKAQALRIGCISGVGLPKILPSTRMYQEKNPNVQISFIPMDTKGLMEELEKESLDAAVTMSMLFEGNDQYESLAVAQVPLIFLYSSQSELAQKKTLTPRDFNDEPLYVVNPAEAAMAISFNKQICDHYKIHPPITLMPTMESIILAISAGNGFTINNAWNRAKDTPEYGYLELDIMESLCVSWKKEIDHPFLREYIDSCLKAEG